MPVFDFNTLTFIAGTISLVMALWLWSLRVRLAGVRLAAQLWLWSLLAQGVGWLLVAMAANWPFALSGLPGNLLIFLSTLLQAEAHRRLLSRKGNVRFSLLLLAVCAGAFTYFSIVEFHTPWRVIVGSLFVLTQFIIIVATIYHSSAWPGPGTRWLIVGLYIAFIALLGLRAVYFASQWHKPQLMAGEISQVSQLAYLLFFFTSFLPTLGFLAMAYELTNQQLELKERLAGVAEEKLQDAYVLLDFALDAAVDAVWDYDVATDHADFSRHWTEMLGFLPGELENSLAAWESRVHPEDLVAANAEFSRLLGGQADAYDINLRMLNHAGQYIWIKDRGRVFSYDAEHRPVRVVGVLKNIDADVRRDNESRYNAQLLDTIFQTAPIAIAVTDRNNRVTRANSYVYSLFGVKSAEELQVRLQESTYIDAQTGKSAKGSPPPILQPRNFVTDLDETFGVIPVAGEEVRWIHAASRYIPALDLNVRVGTDITKLKRAEQLASARSRTLRQLASGAPLEEVLHVLATNVEAILPGDRCSILLLDREKKRLMHGAAPSFDDAYNAAVHELEIGPLAGSCGTAAYTGERVIVTDIDADAGWRRFLEPAHAAGVVACWSEPVKNSCGDVIATFAIYPNERRAPSEWELKTIEAMADLASIAIARAESVRQLQNSEERFRVLFNAIPIGVSLRNQEGQVIDANPRMLDYAEFSLEEMKAGSLRDRSYFDAAGNPLNYTQLPIQQTIQQNRPYEAQLVGYNGTHGRRWFRNSSIMIPELHLYAAIAVEVTTEVEQQQALVRSEAFFRTLFEKLPIGVSIHKRDRTIIEANAVAQEYLGMTPDEMRRGDPLNIRYFDEDGNDVSINDTPGIRALREERDILRQVIGFERAGKRRIVEMSAVRVPIDGMFMIVTLDVTEDRERQKKLEQSEYRFRALFEELPIGVTLHDLNYNLVDANPMAQEYLRLSRAKLQQGEGKKLRVIDNGGLDLPWDQAPGAIAIREGRDVLREIIGIDNGAEIRWFEQSAVHLRAEKKIAIISHDITLDRELQIKLKESEARFRQLFEALPIGAFVVDSQLNVSAVNSVFERQHGIDLSAANAGAIWRRDYFDEDLKPRRLENMPVATAIREQRSVRDSIFAVRISESMHWFSVAVERLPDSDLYLTLVKEVTREYEQQRALQRSEIKFHRVFDLMPVGLALISRTGQISEINEEFSEMTGLNLRAAATEKPGERIFYGLDHQPIKKENLPLVRALQTGSDVHDATVGFKAGDSLRWLRGNIVLVPELDI